MTAELRRDLGGVEGHAGVPLPAQRAPRIPSPPPAPDRSRWERRHTAGVVAVDLAAVVAAAALYRVWGGADGASVLVAGTAVTAVTVAALGVSRAWESSALGQGSLEFARLLRGFVGAAVLIALTGLALQLPQARPWVFAVLPVAGVLSVLGRLLLRRRLHRLRREGRAMTRVLAVGTQDAVAALVDRTRRALHHGWLVTGVCTSTVSRWSATSTPWRPSRSGAATTRCPSGRRRGGRRGGSSSSPGTSRAAASSSSSTPG
jgi:hypothetical protein